MKPNTVAIVGAAETTEEGDVAPNGSSGTVRQHCSLT